MEWVYLSHLINSIEFDRNLQDGSIEVDGGVEVSKRSPGKLRQLNTDTGLYVGELKKKTFSDFICSIIGICYRSNYIYLPIYVCLKFENYFQTRRWNARHYVLYKQTLLFWYYWLHIGNCFRRWTKAKPRSGDTWTCTQCRTGILLSNKLRTLRLE